MGNAHGYTRVVALRFERRWGSAISGNEEREEGRLGEEDWKRAGGKEGREEVIICWAQPI